MFVLTRVYCIRSPGVRINESILYKVPWSSTNESILYFVLEKLTLPVLGNPFIL